MEEVSLKTMTGQDVIFDFVNYTYNQYTFNGTTIYLGSEIADSFNEIYKILSIKAEFIILKDSEGTVYAIPKEDIIYYKNFTDYLDSLTS